MSTASESLASARSAVDDFLRGAEACSASWATPRAPGKWSPAQVLEHVARSLEASALDMRGQRSSLPKIPGLVRPVLRALLFRRVLRSSAFPKAKTNRAMDPQSGPATPAQGRERIEAAWREFEHAASGRAGAGGIAESLLFGAVPLADYVRFQGLHVQHHRGQLPSA